jgi:hypothetical protein
VHFEGCSTIAERGIPPDSPEVVVLSENAPIYDTCSIDLVTAMGVTFLILLTIIFYLAKIYPRHKPQRKVEDLQMRRKAH